MLDLFEALEALVVLPGLVTLVVLAGLVALDEELLVVGATIKVKNQK